MFVIRKKTLLAAAVFMGALFALILCVAALSASPAAGGERQTLKVVIDAGHGGIDAGVTGSTGVKESDLNLQIARQLATQFENA